MARVEVGEVRFWREGEVCVVEVVGSEDRC